MLGPFSRRRLRRLAASPGPVSFLEYVHAQPASSSTWWTLAARAGTESYTDTAYDHYTAWCQKHGKDPAPRPASRAIADGGLGW